MGFLRAITVAHSRFSAISGRALREASLFTTILSTDNSEFGKEALDAYNRCWTHNPEGPQEVSFGNESSTAQILKIEIAQM